MTNAERVAMLREIGAYLRGTDWYVKTSWDIHKIADELEAEGGGWSRPCDKMPAIQSGEEMLSVDCLIATDDGDVFKGYAYSYPGDLTWRRHDGRVVCHNVIAWRPLHAPPSDGAKGVAK